jgi:hypothetical protein
MGAIKNYYFDEINSYLIEEDYVDYYSNELVEEETKPFTMSENQKEILKNLQNKVKELLNK